MDKKQKRDQKVQRQRQLVDAARAAGRELTADEQSEFDSLQREIDTLNEQIRAEDNPQPAAPPASGEQARSENPPADNQEAVRSAVEAERTRISDITALCRDFNVDPTTYIQNGSSMDNVRTALLEQLRTNNGPISSRVRLGDDGEDVFRRDAVDGLLLHGGLEPEKPSTEARQMASMSLRDLAIECLTRGGMANAHRLSSDALFTEVCSRQYFNPTAAFPSILDNAINKAYVEGHRTAAVTFDRWTKKGTLTDFKRHDNNYLAGPVGDFVEVPEGGELKNDRPTDAKLPTRQLKTYGKQFTLSRQAFINDDIDLVTRIPARYAAAARRTINTQCYQILMNNPEIYDGQKLFHKDHGNLIKTGTGITKEAMQAMIMAISTQKDQFDQPIIVRPAALIVPTGYAFDMYTLFNSPTIQTTDNTQAVNPLYQYRILEIIEDPTINAMCGGFGHVMPWWLLANREDTEFIEVDYLNGQEIPTIRRMETAGQLGFVWDIWLDWGISVMDYRGAIKNPGVQIDSPLG